MSDIKRTASLQRHWKEITAGFLKIGSLAYGGPAIMGLMQAEFQEKRQWLDKSRFLEGLSLVNLLPGAGATQLGIFLGYTRGGWWGGLLAGLCFVLPAFFIMMALTLVYATLGGSPLMSGALYGLGPVVLGIFIVAVYRLGKNAITGGFQLGIALSAALATYASPLGIVMVLALSGAIGITLFHSRRMGLFLLMLFALVWGLGYGLEWTQPTVAEVTDGVRPAGLAEVGAFFFKVGMFTFGGGLTMIAFVQDQVVTQYQWLTPREFVDGLALGQFTPGPILMVAAYVGYKVSGIGGAIVGAAAIFLPSFILMLSVLPILDRVRNLGWMKAAMRGIGPAVIGILFVSLTQIAPHAVVDGFSLTILIITVMILLRSRVGVIKLMVGGAGAGILRDRLV